jgi:peroxiredoxin
MILTGREWGTATENISRMVRGPTPLIAAPGAPAVMSIIADTAFDLRQYSVEGVSGFQNVRPPSFRPRYHPGQSTLIWPNGLGRAAPLGHCHEASHTTDPIPQGNKC